MAELKPCPFCGGDAQIEHIHSGFGFSYVICKKCGVESVKFIKSFEVSSDKQAVEFWNRRDDNG